MTEARVGPKSGVGDGPPVAVIGGEVGETVGVASWPGVRVADGVSDGVTVGMSVGTMGTAAAPQPASSRPSRATASSARIRKVRAHRFGPAVSG